MASRYGVLIRSARSSVQTSFRRSSSAARSPFPGRTRIPLRNDTDNAAFRRRFSYISRLPVELGCALHSAVADAKLVSHLSVNSRTCSALSLGLQGYMNATLCTVPARNPLGWRDYHIEDFSFGLKKKKIGETTAVKTLPCVRASV